MPTRPPGPLDEFPSIVERPVANELLSERRGFRPGGVLIAALVAIFLSFTPIPLPPPGSLDAALSEIAFVSAIRSWGTFAALVVILSIGRQGIDVLLLRSMLATYILGLAFVGLILGAVFVGPIPFPVNPSIPWPVFLFAAGLIWAVILGPVVAVVAALANLLWYRSFRSLRPQLFSRGSSRVRSNP